MSNLHRIQLYSYSAKQKPYISFQDSHQLTKEARKLRADSYTNIQKSYKLIEESHKLIEESHKLYKTRKLFK